jgi:hypothetical protein
VQEGLARPELVAGAMVVLQRPEMEGRSVQEVLWRSGQARSQRQWSSSQGDWQAAWLTGGGQEAAGLARVAQVV